MTDKTATETFFGKEKADKDKLFTGGLNEIQARHIDFFKARPPHWTHEQHDLIKHHVMTMTVGTNISLGFPREKKNDDKLRSDIKNEVIALFQQVYGTQQP
jgi:hypothetical protein